MRIDSWCVLNPLSARSLFSKTRYHSLRKYMKFIIGKKQDMIQFFDDKGQSFPATILSVSPAVVTKVKTKKKSGYGAFQIEITAKKKRISKSEKGHLKGLSALKPLKEFRLKGDTPSGFSRGDTFDVTIFKEGDTVAITGVSKGKGFQGVVKRHKFAGGPRTHGQKHSEREPGSIGGGLRTHVPKGMRMAGRMGGDRITQKNLKVVFVDKENNIMLVKGAIAGKRGSLVEIIKRGD